MAPTNRLHTSAQHRSTTKHVTVVCNMKHHGIQKCPYILSACIILEQGFLFIFFTSLRNPATVPVPAHHPHCTGCTTAKTARVTGGKKTCSSIIQWSAYFIKNRVMHPKAYALNKVRVLFLSYLFQVVLKTELL